jgi:hypothetical protein
VWASRGRTERGVDGGNPGWFVGFSVMRLSHWGLHVSMDGKNGPPKSSLRRWPATGQPRGFACMLAKVGL